MDEIIAKLQPIFREVLDNPQLILTSESNASNVAGWDSLAQISLVSAIEQQFKIRFSLSELEKLANVGDMIELMREKLGR